MWRAILLWLAKKESITTLDHNTNWLKTCSAVRLLTLTDSPACGWQRYRQMTRYAANTLTSLKHALTEEGGANQRIHVLRTLLHEADQLNLLPSYLLPKQALRVISNIGYNGHTNALFKKIKIKSLSLKLMDLKLMRTSEKMLKAWHKLVPENKENVHLTRGGVLLERKVKKLYQLKKHVDYSLE